jgi:molybdate transport system substrate-binding protein
MKSHLLVCFILMAAFTAALQAAEVTIFAAASLTNAMKDIASAYEAKSGDKLVFNFAGSNELATQIKKGAPVDIFFSADEIQMDGLAKAGLIDSASRTDLLSNTLVIVVPKDGPASLTPAGLEDAAIKRLALADPKSVPAGVYARDYLTKLGLWNKLESKVVPTVNVRAALAAVESGNVEAGIVYKTDAGISKAVKIAYEVPRGEGPAISYPVALVKGGPDAEAARKFLSYLESDEGAAVFKKYGFLSAAKDGSTN